MTVCECELAAKIYEKDKKLKRDDVKNLMEWNEKQVHLPQMSELQVILFLHSCYYSNERAKEAIDNFFTVKTHWPEMFTGQDPRELLPTTEIALHVFLPRTTPQGDLVLYARVTHPNPGRYQQIEQHKVFDMYTMSFFHENGPAEGVIAVLDMEGMAFGHVTRYGIVNTKKFLYYIQEAIPFRLKQVHVINVASFVDKIMAIARPFIKKELLDILHFHTSLETFFKYVPREILPEHLGGTAGTLAQLRENENSVLLRNADFLLEQEKQIVDESRRPGKPKNTGDVFGVEGTFKKLEID